MREFKDLVTEELIDLFNKYISILSKDSTQATSELISLIKTPPFWGPREELLKLANSGRLPLVQSRLLNLFTVHKKDLEEYEFIIRQDLNIKNLVDRIIFACRCVDIAIEPGATKIIMHHPGDKCERCRDYYYKQSLTPRLLDHPNLCPRCENVIEELEKEYGPVKEWTGDIYHMRALKEAKKES
jgi:hypothetical protein